MQTKKYFYDTEFLEDGKTIELISIGIRCEDGREYYAENKNMPWDRILDHNWIMDNVYPWLESGVNTEHPCYKPKKQIAREVLAFLTPNGTTPELWAWFAAYDHVVLAQLWGVMINMPRGLPQYTKDIRQLLDHVGINKLPAQTSTEHHALADARHNEVMYNYLMKAWEEKVKL